MKYQHTYLRREKKNKTELSLACKRKDLSTRYREMKNTKCNGSIFDKTVKITLY